MERRTTDDDRDDVPVPETRWIPAFLVVPVLVVLLGTVLSVRARESDAAFLYAQSHPSRVEPANLAKLVAKAREPVAGGRGARATSARCVGRQGVELGNPWICTVRYASRRTLRFRVVVNPDGSIVGENRASRGRITGCCVATPSRG